MLIIYSSRKKSAPIPTIFSEYIKCGIIFSNHSFVLYLSIKIFFTRSWRNFFIYDNSGVINRIHINSNSITMRRKFIRSLFIHEAVKSVGIIFFFSRIFLVKSFWQLHAFDRKFDKK